MTSTLTGEKPADMTPGDKPSPRLGGWSYRILLALVLGIGIFGATRVWWAALGMWKDEAGIANNLLRSYGLLTGHLK
ncbi:MAG TPA: hypothetical protein VK659_26665, partial [Asanoa sp.]|nr:hypothetical protein [Asanoa sp.]